MLLVKKQENQRGDENVIFSVSDIQLSQNLASKMQFLYFLAFNIFFWLTIILIIIIKYDS